MQYIYICIAYKHVCANQMALQLPQLETFALAGLHVYLWKFNIIAHDSCYPFQTVHLIIQFLLTPVEDRIKYAVGCVKHFLSLSAQTRLQGKTGT